MALCVFLLKLHGQLKKVSFPDKDGPIFGQRCILAVFPTRISKLSEDFNLFFKNIRQFMDTTHHVSFCGTEDLMHL